MERKLTAILCADVFGYSRLMGENEEATLRTLSAHRKLIDSLIEQHHGRFVNSAGDSVLAEFASVVNAVQCAVAIQTTLNAENAPLPPDRRMEFRIGVNLGDVVVDGEQIYGDGVNVAARLEGLTDPGGIFISGSVREQLGNRLGLAYEDLGEQAVKNIAKPVRVFRVILESRAATRTATKVAKRSLRKHWRGGVFSLAGLAILVGTIVFVQHLSLRPPTTTASIPPAKSPALTLPDKPSVAVLPFTNMSSDREQEYFSDGITDDIITEISRGPDIFVIDRASTFTYKGKPVRVRDVSRELGVKYVLEGGVQKAGDQVRISVQLVDATTGTDLWAERYDRPMKDIFSLQDEIVRRIVTTLNLQLTLARRGLLIPRTTDNLEAYDDVLRGVEYLPGETREKARQMFEKAIALDPRYARAYWGLGATYWVGWVALLSPDPNGLERAFELEQQAIVLDDSLAPAHGFLAAIYVKKGEYERAVTEAERSIALNPNSAFGYFWLAEVMNNIGRPTEALAAVEKAMRLDPRNGDNYVFQQGLAYTQLGRYEEAIPALKRDLAFTNNLWDHVHLVRDYIELGQEDAARAEAAEVERRSALNPNSPIGYLGLAQVINSLAERAEALMTVQKAMRLDPGDRDHDLLVEGQAYQGLARYEDSITAYKRFLALHPYIYWAHVGLAVDDIELGRNDAAQAEAAEVLRLNPQFNVDAVFRTVGPKGKVLAENARWSADLHKAGLK